MQSFFKSVSIPCLLVTTAQASYKSSPKVEKDPLYERSHNVTLQGHEPCQHSSTKFIIMSKIISKDTEKLGFEPR